MEHTLRVVAGDLPYGVVILAAGASVRMGRPKLLLPWGDTTVIGHQVRTWAGLGARQIAVVTRPGDDALLRELGHEAVSSISAIVNPEPDRGMFGSIREAARWDGWVPDFKRVVLSLGDQPHLRRETLQGLLEVSSRNPDRICQPSWHGRARHPVILPREKFQALAKSRAEILRAWLEAEREHVVLCEMEDAGLDADLDTPEDYRRLTAEFGQDEQD